MTRPVSRDKLRVAIRSAVAAIAIALLLLSSATHRALALPVDPSTAGTNQVLVCQAGGGRAVVSEDMTVASGTSVVLVKCIGGWFDGVFCSNHAGEDTLCGYFPGLRSKPTHGRPTVDPSAMAADPALVTAAP